MHSCASFACALLVLAVAFPASAGGRKTAPDSGPLVVLRGDLLEAGGLDAPFADPGPVVGRFVLRSSDHGDLRVDPGVARLNVRGGALRARAADPGEDRGGLLDLCGLGMTPFPCLTTLPFRPDPAPLPPIPLIPLHTHTDPIGFHGVLSDQQQALLGCGSYYGTVCDDTLFFLPGVRAGGNGSFGRRDFVWIPGDPDDGFVYSRDVDPRTGRPRQTSVEPPVWLDPGVGFQSEMAVLSWNALMLLVAQSQSDGVPAEDEYDPSDPYRTDGCSFAAPHFCIGVGGFIDSEGWRFAELEGDPRGGERLQWLWESSIAYDIVHARGELAAFLDGRLYVYGPFESPIEGFASGVALLLVPPQGAVPDVSSPMMRIVPGPDRTFETEDDSVVGFAWGASWPAGVVPHALGRPGRASDPRRSGRPLHNERARSPARP